MCAHIYLNKLSGLAQEIKETCSIFIYLSFEIGFGMHYPTRTNESVSLNDDIKPE
jgi:hypothetical protein